MIDYKGGETYNYSYIQNLGSEIRLGGCEMKLVGDVPKKSTSNCAQYNPKISFVGDCAIRVTFGDEVNLEINNKVQSFTKYLKLKNEPLFQEIVPSFTSVLISLNLKKSLELCKRNNIDNPYELLKLKVEEFLKQPFFLKEDNKKVIEIPVCYDGEFGPDLQEVARINNLSKEDVILKHSSKDYFVYMLGFAPGFPYLAGVDPVIATPRKQTPRLKIEAGSVGIAGEQTGIYSIATPGGWQIIGRTPKKLFTPEKDKPTLLNAGDWIRFKAISEEEYFQIEGGE